MSTDLAAERLLSAADAGAGDPERAARLVFQAFVAMSRTADGRQMLPLVARVQRLHAADGSPAVELIYRTLAGVVATRARLADGPHHLDAAVEIFDRNPFGADPLLVECALLSVLTRMRPHEARRLAPLVDALDLEPRDRARMLGMIGLGDAWAGNLVRGQAEMLEAAQLAAMAGSLDVQAEVTSWLVKCEALRGDLEASAAHLDEARVLAAQVGSTWVARHIPECTAALAFSRGDFVAWASLLELIVEMGIGTDSGLLAEFRWELATHHALAGRRDVAARLLDGSPDPPVDWPGGHAMPAWRAWILDPDAPAAMAALEASLADLTQPTERLPTARISWLLGAHHARAGRRADAIRLLEQACSLYAQNGAGGMLALAAADLRAVDARPPAPPAVFAPTPGEAALTGAEVRVAVAIADGLSNREAAERLFVSVKTIEFHLGNIFRKLGVRNRTELAARRAQLG